MEYTSYKGRYYLGSLFLCTSDLSGSFAILTEIENVDEDIGLHSHITRCFQKQSLWRFRSLALTPTLPSPASSCCVLITSYESTFPQMSIDQDIREYLIHRRHCRGCLRHQNLQKQCTSS